MCHPNKYCKKEEKCPNLTPVGDMLKTVYIDRTSYIDRLVYVLTIGNSQAQIQIEALLKYKG